MHQTKEPLGVSEFTTRSAAGELEEGGADEGPTEKQGG
jgi:hypothetical protein